MTTTSDLQARLLLLRQRFDGAFAAAPAPPPCEHEDLLAVRLGAERHCIRLSEVAGMYRSRGITPLPSRSPHLLGTADFRGELVAVFDLGALLGEAPCAEPRYLVRSLQRQVAFGFEHFDGHQRVEKTVALHGVIDLGALLTRLERELASAKPGVV